MHLIRPLIKPYVSTVDSLLDLARMVGDIFFFVSATPVRHARSWWSRSLWPTSTDRPHSSMYGNLRSLDGELPPDASAYPAIVPHMSELSQSSPGGAQQSVSRVKYVRERTNEQQEPSLMGNSKEHLLEVPVRTRRQGLQASIASKEPSTSRLNHRIGGRNRVNEKNIPLRATFDGPKPHEPQLYRWQLNESNFSKATAPHQIWNPPPSAYVADDPDSQPEPAESEQRPSRSRRSSVTAEATAPRAEPGISAVPEVDEWRLYPPFPSAYPLTPSPASAVLPSVTPITPRRPSDKVQFPPVKKEKEQSFGQSLMPREPSNPSSDASISDDKYSINGVQNYDSSSDGGSMDVDSEDEDSDDAFDITLRTPRRKRPAKLPTRRAQSNALSSALSTTTSRLTTVDKESRLRTRSNSESSSSMSFSDTSSVAGHKRSFPQVDTVDLQKTVKPMEKTRHNKSSKGGKVSSARITSRSVQQPRRRQISTSASETVDEDEAPHGDGIGTKKRRVVKEGAGLSASNLPNVAPEHDAVNVRAIAEGPPILTRGSRRGRAFPPSRTSSRLANSRTTSRNLRSAPGVANSSQSTLTGGKPIEVIPPPHNRNTKK